MVGRIVHNPPRRRIRGGVDGRDVLICGGLRTSLPTGWLGPNHAEGPSGGIVAKAPADWIVGDVFGLFREFGLVSQAMIEESVLPSDASRAGCPAFPIPYDSRYVGGFRERCDEVDVVGHYDGDLRKDKTLGAVVLNRKDELHRGIVCDERRGLRVLSRRGDGLRRVGATAPHHAIMAAVGADGDEVWRADDVLRHAYGCAMRKVLSGRVSVKMGVHSADIIAYVWCEWLCLDERGIVGGFGRAACPQAAGDVDNVWRRVGDNAPYQRWMFAQRIGDNALYQRRAILRGGSKW